MDEVETTHLSSIRVGRQELGIGARAIDVLLELIHAPYILGPVLLFALRSVILRSNWGCLHRIAAEKPFAVSDVTPLSRILKL